MNTLDIFLIIPLIWFAWRGFSKGLFLELAMIVALFIGIYFGCWLSSVVSGFLVHSWGMTSRYVPVMAYAITFILIIVAVFLLAKMLEKSMNLLALGLINKLAGAFFGLLKAVFLLSLLLYLLNKLDAVPQKKRDASLLYNPVSSIAPTIIPKLDIEKFKPDTIQKQKK